MPEEHEHTRDDLWKELNKTKDDITDVKSAISSIGSELKGLSAAFQSFAQNHNRPTNWVGLASLIVSLGVAMALWVAQSQEPIERSVADLKLADATRLERELHRTYQLGQKEAQLELIWTLMLDDKDRMHKMEQNDAGQQSAIESLEQQLNAVDSGGSRIWNKRDLP